MTRPALIVCEPNSFWASRLRQASATEPLPLVETRRPEDAWQQVRAAPASMVAVAWNAEPRAGIAEFVDQVGQRFPRVPIVALLDRMQVVDDGDRGEQWLAYELGAIHVCSSPRQVATVVRLARRHLGSHAVARHWRAMHERMEEIWQTLPWNSQEGFDLA